MYCMGEIDFQVIPTNVVRALGLFKRSAQAGYPQAQATIGALYLKGLPGLLEKDTKQGISMLSKAVMAKSLTARFNLEWPITTVMACRKMQSRHPNG